MINLDGKKKFLKKTINANFLTIKKYILNLQKF